MDQLFHDISTQAYLDDVVVGTDTWEEHIRILT